MTERLYYTQPALTEFDAVVVRVTPEGDRWLAVLDRTAFFPTSGGQPFDTGTLDAARVLDVVDQADGSIAHVIDRPVEAGRTVRGRVDWARRFDHMQQHTGQHLLSAAFERVCGARTVGFHLGGAASTIDLDRDLSARQVDDVEAEANRIIWENRTVTIRFVDAEEAAALPLRRGSTRVGELRLIEIDDYDLSACGGTHLATTGAIGAMAITGAERYKGGMRVEFLCGGRAVAAFRSSRRLAGELARQLSVSPPELPAAVARLQTEQKDLRKAMRLLQDRVALAEAARLAAAAPIVRGFAVVVEVLPALDAARLRTLASTIVADRPSVVALFSDAGPALAVMARSDAAAVDVSAVLRCLHEEFGGRGGGTVELAQGGGLNAPLETLLARARELLSEAIMK